MKCADNKPLPLNLCTQSYKSFPLYPFPPPHYMRTCFNALTGAPAVFHLLIH